MDGIPYWSVVPDLVLAQGAEVELTADEVQGSADRLSLRPRSTFQALRPRSRVGIDFHGVLLRVIETGPASARAVVDRGGRIGSNKAVTIDPSPILPALTAKSTKSPLDRPAWRRTAVGMVTWPLSCILAVFIRIG